jgi:glutaconate CoA-transferase subunit A
MTGGTLRMKDATCPAIYAALEAGEKGNPFTPLRGLIGSDLMKIRSDWRVIDNPFGNDDPVVLLPAIRPDVALFHAPMADRHGNVWIGRQRDLATLAHASHKTVVTVERIVDGSLMDDPVLAAGVLPGFYVEAVATVENGAWPLSLPDYYPVDVAHLAEYARLAKTEEGFARYCDEHVYRKRAA